MAEVKVTGSADIAKLKAGDTFALSVMDLVEMGLVKWDEVVHAVDYHCRAHGLRYQWRRRLEDSALEMRIMPGE